MWSKFWPNLSIRLKVFILCFAIALAPILAVNTLWSMSAHQQLRQAARQSQEKLLANSSQRIDEFFAAKTNTVEAYAKNLGAVNFQDEQTGRSLLRYMAYDEAILRASLVDSDGNERLVADHDGLTEEKQNVKDSDIYQAAIAKQNGAVIGDVAYELGEPHVVIAMAIRPADTEEQSAQAQSSQPNDPGYIGVFMVDISTHKLWNVVLNAPLGKEGYTYIVDAKGRLIAHPDSKFFRYHLDLSNNDQVSQFLQEPGVGTINTTTVSEKGVKVMSGYEPILRTGWAVITEEPEVSLYDPVQDVYRTIMWVFIVCTLFVTLLSYYFSRTLTRPLHSVVKGASELGQGNLDTRISIKSKDEIGVLAKQFNTMADNLNHLVSSLKVQSTKLNIVLDSVGEGIVAIDSEGRIVVANMSAAILAEELPISLTGRNFDDVFRLNKNNQPFHLDLTSTQVYKEIVFMSPNRRLHYLDIFANKIKDDPDGITNIITLRDQTDERDLEMMKHDFVSMAAHELRTPITAIRGYLGLLAEDKTSDLSETSKNSIERARSSTNELVGLINNLLNVSKIEGGTLDMAFDKLDWVKMIGDAINDQRFGAEEKEIVIEYEGPEKDVVVVADELAIKEVINNLIANAIHYTETGGHVTVAVVKERGEVVTHVKDDGIGISPNATGRLFTKFYRVKSSIASGSGGTGLGLFISKSIVELHKGRIWVESAEGKGSTFSFSLPAYDEVQYDALEHKQSEGVRKHRGWSTKNTTR